MSSYKNIKIVLILYLFMAIFLKKIFFEKVTELLKKIVFLHPQNTAIVAQLVRVPDCGSEGRGFESH